MEQRTGGDGMAWHQIERPETRLQSLWTCWTATVSWTAAVCSVSAAPLFLYSWIKTTCNQESSLVSVSPHWWHHQLTVLHTTHAATCEIIWKVIHMIYSLWSGAAQTLLICLITSVWAYVCACVRVLLHVIIPQRFEEGLPQQQATTTS